MVFKKNEYEKEEKVSTEMSKWAHPLSLLVFGTNGGMRIDCQMFLKQFAEKLPEKDQERYAVVIAWLKTRISFEILRSVHVSVRGTRSPFHRKQYNVTLRTIF